MRALILFAFFVSALLGRASPTHAQVVPAESAISGSVVDATTGTVLAGAVIRLSGAQERVAQADSRGLWRLASVPSGSFTLTVSQVGFADSESRVDLPTNVGEITIRLTPSPVSLDALVVTAGRREQRLADVAVATEVLSRRDIERSAAPDLSTLLSQRAGIELQGGHPAGAGVMIQGLGSERVLVLVDGQPFIGRIAGQLDLSRIPSQIIERVEIVRGPLSTLYGSEAMGGVVNVITRSARAASLEPYARAVAGEQGRVDLSGGLAGGVGATSGRLDLGRRVIAAVPGQATSDGQDIERWDGNIGLRFAPLGRSFTVETGALLLDESQRWRSGPLFQFADNTQWMGRLQAIWQAGDQRLSSTTALSEFRHLSRRGTSATAVPGSGDSETQSLLESDVLYGLSLGDHRLDAGVELKSERIRSDRVTDSRRRSETIEAFAQATGVVGDVTFVPGLRVTRSDPWGSHWTPHVAAMYRPAPGLTLRASVGEGFRVPDFKELHMEFLNIGPGFGYTVRGNPSLDPETSRNLTASVERSGARTYTRLQVFHNRFRGFIETQAVGDSSGITVYTYGNIDQGTTQGVEAEVGLTSGGWRFDGTYAWLDARRDDDDSPLLGRPTHSLSGAVSYTRPTGITLSVEGAFTGRTPMLRTESGTEWRNRFVRFNTRVSQELPRGFQLMLGADNLFDRRNDEWPGFTGRHFYTGLTWRPATSTRN